jgi:hypothetical protein
MFHPRVVTDLFGLGLLAAGVAVHVIGKKALGGRVGDIEPGLNTGKNMSIHLFEDSRGQK